MYDLDAGGLGVRDGRLDLCKCLFLLQPIENFLAAALDAEHHRAAPRLGEFREQVLGDRVDTPLRRWPNVSRRA
jgi:hypothetical protein